MAKLSGTLVGGAPFEISVTARTKWLRLFKHELATLDLSALSAAPKLEDISTGSSPIAIPSLAPLAACPALTNLTLALPADTDLSPLAGCKTLGFLWLKLHGAAACKTTVLAEIQSLDTLSILQRGNPPPLDLAPIKGLELEDLSLDGITNVELDLSCASSSLDTFYVTGAASLSKLDLTPLAGTSLEYLMVQSCPALRRLDLAPLAKLPLKRLTFASTGLEELSLAPLAGCTSLEHVQIRGHNIRFLDVTPLAALGSLDSLDLDGHPPFLSESHTKKIASPALRAWFKAGALNVQ